MAPHSGFAPSSEMQEHESVPSVFRVEPDKCRNRASRSQTVLAVLSKDPQATIRALA